MLKSPNLSAQKIFGAGPVVPVLVVDDLHEAHEITSALEAGGVKVIEVTLRTPQALEILRALCVSFPHLLIGAGPVTTPEQYKQAEFAGATFCISPGCSVELLQAGNEGMIPLIPGVSSTSEAMLAKNLGYRFLKFFPAVASGGTAMLSALRGPFPELVFCPTGGISQSNANQFLALPNVKCVGGSWLAPKDAVTEKNWGAITELAIQSRELS